MIAAIVIAAVPFVAGCVVAVYAATDISHGVGQWMRDRRRRRTELELPRAVWRRR